ncbi:manganese efflux pump [uncultured Ruminococcus sp.]|uniref:manganese efflux pump n=1 Tax=uncultured Ruminococcus sp. TaxID=165186 RepID=UPI0026184CEF|nr:manganese efflux pump [uncultured Ruminococcus sp.]
MLKELFISFIVSIDIFLAAAACCNSGIRIPLLSALLIDLISAAVLGISMTFSDIISHIFPMELCRTAGEAVLIIIGAATIAKSLFRSLVRRVTDKGELLLKMKGSPLMVKLCIDDTAADADRSMVLSAGEAAALALASSFDSAATGLSCGCSGMSAAAASLFTLLCGAAAIILGGLTGRKISSLRHDLSWAGGVLLIIFAVFQS